MAEITKYSTMTDALMVYGGDTTKTPTSMQQMMDFMKQEADTVGHLVDSMLWQPSKQVRTSQVVYSPNLPPGYIAECKTPGQTGNNEPNWNVDTKTYSDGTVTWELKNAVGGDGVAVGMIVPYAGGGDIPVGYLLCNGASVSKVTYQDLFNAIGYTYGGSGNSFNLPNLVDKFIEGGNVAGVSGGEAEHTLTVAEMPAHGHNTYTWNNNNQNSQAKKYDENSELVDAGSGGRINSLPWQSSAFKTAGDGIGDPNGATALMGGGQPHNNLPPFLTMRYIIKAFAGASVDSSDIAITNVANELNSFKAQVDSKGFITENSSNKAEKGFVKFSNGFIVQWGWENLGTHENRLVTFPTPFSSMNYQVTCCGRTTETNKASGVTSHYCQSNSVTNFYLCQDYTANETPQWASWIACGF